MVSDEARRRLWNVHTEANASGAYDALISEAGAITLLSLNLFTLKVAALSWLPATSIKAYLTLHNGRCN